MIYNIINILNTTGLHTLKWLIICFCVFYPKFKNHNEVHCTSVKVIKVKKTTELMWQPGWEGGLQRMNTCVCMAESLCSPLFILNYHKIAQD